MTESGTSVSAQPTMSKSKKRWMRLAAVALSLFMTLFALEVAARIYAYIKYGSQDAYNWDFFKEHHYLCYEAYHNYDGIVAGKHRIQTNSLGFRSPELNLPPSPPQYISDRFFRGIDHVLFHDFGQ